jgi:hypothetical protein
MDKDPGDNFQLVYNLGNGGVVMDAEKIAKNRNAHIKTEDFLQEYFKNLKQKLAYDPENDFIQWKKEVKRKLIKLLKLPENGDLSGESDIVWTGERDGYRVEKHIIYPEPFSAVPYLVLIPDKAASDKKTPGVICISGSSGTKELLANEPEIDGKPTSNKHPYHNRMAWHFVQAGYVAVTVENPGVGELKRDEANIWADRSEFSARMLMRGRNYIGISTHQKLCLVEWMKKQEYIDSEKLAVSAHSLGAEPAIAMSLISDDIKAMVYNDLVANRLERKNKLIRGELIGGFWHEIPDMFEWFTYVDLMAANAPKPSLFTEGGITADLDIIKKSYENAGALDNLEIHYYRKFRNLEDRLHEYEELPENIDLATFYDYANVDVNNHFFKEYHAIPWLNAVFNMKN